jgi:hypothetical protein
MEIVVVSFGGREGVGEEEFSEFALAEWDNILRVLV